MALLKRKRGDPEDTKYAYVRELYYVCSVRRQTKKGEPGKQWFLGTPRDKLIKIGAKVERSFSHDTADGLHGDGLESLFEYGRTASEPEIAGIGISETGIDILDVVAEVDHLVIGSPCDFQQGAAYADIIGHENIPRRYPVINRIKRIKGRQFRITCAIRRLFVVHLFKPLFHGLIDHFVPNRRFAESAPVQLDSRVTVDEDIVLDDEVSPASEKNCAMKTPEDVAVYLRAADAVVHIDPHRAHADPAGVMDKVMADDIAAIGIIPPGVDGADIAGLKAYVMDFIFLDEMLVPAKEDRTVGVVVDEIVDRDDSDTRHGDGRGIAARPSSDVVDVIVAGEVASGRDCFAVAAR